MKGKSILYFLLLVLLVLGLGVVSASENITDTHEITAVESTPVEEVSSDFLDSEDLSQNYEQESLSSSDSNILSDESHSTGTSWDGLKDDINNLNDNDIIYLDGKTYIQNSESIKITKDITIVGGSSLSDSTKATLDGNENFRMMWIGSNVTLIGINFINGKVGDENGGSIYMDKNSKLTLINCSFKNSYSENRGGAIYVEDDGELNIIGSTFENNFAMYGGAIANTNGTINITNSIFSNNIANVTGGAICSRFRGFSLSATYEQQTNPASYIKITMSDFNNNFAYSTAGAVYGDVIEIYNSEFSDNFAGYSSGAIMGAVISVDKSSFINNSVFLELEDNIHYGYPYSGGAITIQYNGSINDSEFIHNYARYGGAIFTDNNNDAWIFHKNGSYEIKDLNLSLKLKNNIFKDNRAVCVGGAVFSLTKLFDYGSIFSNNSAFKEGGALFTIRGISLTNTEIVDNIAMYGAGTSSITVNELNNVKFKNNKAFYGDNIAFNKSDINLNIDNRNIYKFVNPLESGNSVNLSDGYIAFLGNPQYEDYGDYQWLYFSYPNIDRHIYSPEEYRFLERDMYFLANYSDINNGIQFVIDYYAAYLDELDTEYWLFEYVDELSNYSLFSLNKWEELKLNKTRELLNDSSISGSIPDHGYFKQINSTTYIFIDFEVLESELLTRQYIKGPGYFSFWLPAYKLTYKTISEIANLTVEKKSLNNIVNVGEISSFEIIVKNTGLINLTGVFVQEIIPDGLVYSTYYGDNWIKEGNMFYYGKTLEVNQTASFIIDFIALTEGNFTNSVIAGSNETDNVTSNDTVEVQSLENVTDEEFEGFINATDDGLENDLSEVLSESENPEEVLSESSQPVEKKVLDVENATGNPLVVLLAVLAVLGIGLRRRD